MKKNKKMIFIIFLFLILGIIYFCFKDKFLIDKDINNGNIINKNESSNDKNIDIKTSSGVVLVGTIKKDNAGWYFAPEQPLNITLTYYINNPEYFENVNKIRLLQDDLDSLGHTLVVNELVTITGELTNPRGAGILYIVPYVIQNGRKVELSQAKEDVKPLPIEIQPFDYSLLPNKMKSKMVNGEYKYNFYMLSNETLDYVGNDFLTFYLEFVDAYLNYKTSIPCPSKDYAEKLSIILAYEFPVFKADGEYDILSMYDSNNKTISWKYTSKSKEEHDRLISNFEADANKFLYGVNEEQSDSLKAQIIYHNMTTTIKYDYDGFETGINIDPYYVYQNHTGVCFSFSFVYSQLLTQVGVESTIATSTPVDAIIGHSWNVIKIDNKYYFCDPTYELSFKNGTAYVYFGINMDQRLNNGEYIKEKIYIGKYQTVIASLYDEFADTLQIQNLNF